MLALRWRVQVLVYMLLRLLGIEAQLILSNPNSENNWDWTLSQVLSSTALPSSDLFVISTASSLTCYVHNPMARVGGPVTISGGKSVDYQADSDLLISAGTNFIKLYTATSTFVVTLAAQNLDLNINTCTFAPGHSASFFVGTGVGRTYKFDSSLIPLYSVANIQLPTIVTVTKISPRINSNLLLLSVQGTQIYQLQADSMVVNFQYSMLQPVGSVLQDDLAEDIVYVSDTSTNVRKVTFNGVSNAVVSSITVGTGGSLTNMERIANLQYLLTTSGKNLQIVDLSTFTKVLDMSFWFASYSLRSMSPSMYITGTSVFFAAGRNAYLLDSPYFEIDEISGLECRLSNCIVCLSLVACQECSANYLLKYDEPNLCIPVSSIPAGYGILLGVVPATIHLCSITHCANCELDSGVCSSCFAGWVLNTVGTDCINSGFLPGYGPDHSSGLEKPCEQVACKACDAAVSTCTSCSLDLGYFYYSLNASCITIPQIPIGRGADNTAATVEACLSPECIECRRDFRFCKQCDQNQAARYLYNFACLTAQQLDTAVQGMAVPGFGLDPESHGFLPCTDRFCSDCHEDYRLCLACNASAEKPHLRDTSCISSNDILPGYGLDPQSQSVYRCLQSTCLQCVKDFQTCKFEEPPFLWSESPDLSYVEVLWKASRLIGYKPTQFSLVYLASVFEGGVNVVSKHRYDLQAFIKQNIRVSNVALHNNLPDNALAVEVAVHDFYAAVPSLLIGIRLRSGSSFRYNVTVDFEKSWFVSSKTGRRFVIQNMSELSAEVNLSEETACAEDGRAYGSQASKLILSQESSATSSVIISIIVGFDPTDMLLKLVQMIKLMNKSKYLNSFMGPKLQEFFNQLHDPKSPFSRPRTVDFEEKTRTGYHGKLSEHKVSLEFFQAYYDKALLYVVSSILMFVKRLFGWRRFKVSAFSLKLAHLYPRIHLMVFKIVMMDFCFYGLISLFQTREWEANKLMSFICLTLVCIDLWEIAASLVSDREWQYVMLIGIRRHKQFKEVQILEQSAALNNAKQKRNSVAASKRISSKKQNQSIIQRESTPESGPSDASVSPKKASHTQINYEATYDLMNRNRHLVELICDDLMPLQSKILPIDMRVFLMLHLLRLPLYQMLILSCQYAITVIFVTVSALEAYRFAYVIWNFVNRGKRKVFGVCFLIYQMLQASVMLVMAVQILRIHMSASSFASQQTDETSVIVFVFVSVALELVFVALGTFIFVCRFVRDMREDRRATKVGVKMEGGLLDVVRYSSFELSPAACQPLIKDNYCVYDVSCCYLGKNETRTNLKQNLLDQVQEPQLSGVGVEQEER